MNKTKKADTATTDAPGIKTTTPAPVACSEDTGTESSVPDPEDVTPDPCFWRRITDEDVKAAIKGSYLETLCEVLSKNYRGKPPFPMILGHAILLMSATLTHQGEEPGFIVDNDGGLIPAFQITPARQSRLYINTGHGNVPNAYVMVVAPSGAGKSLGYIQLAESLGYTVMNDGSPEGIKDAAMENPHILLEIQELSDVLKGRGPLGRFKKGLTDMFNAGKFNDKFSKRTGAPERSAPWFYPSVYAAIQPELLKALGRELDIEQGLFGRFLVFTLSESDMGYSFNPCNQDDEKDLNRLHLDLRAISEIEGSVDVPDPEYNTKFTEPILAEISKMMRPLVLRYGNEYLPRIALMLAIPNSPADIPQTPPVLTTDHLTRASIILYRILSMAETALGALTNLEGHARSLEENLQKMVQLIARLSETTEAGLLVNQISRNSNRTGWDSKTRVDLLNELAARGWIMIAKNGQKLESIEKGCRIALNRPEIPSGIL
jgi:hypothetical protein